MSTGECLVDRKCVGEATAADEENVHHRRGMAYKGRGPVWRGLFYYRECLSAIAFVGNSHDGVAIFQRANRLKGGVWDEIVF